MAVDIHGYDKDFASLIHRIQVSTLSDENKKLLLEFDQAMLLLERLGIPRRLKLLGTMFYLAEHYFHGDISALTIGDIKAAVSQIEGLQRSPWTKAAYKIVLRKFMKWRAYGDMEAGMTDLPDSVKWIRVHVRKKDRRQVQASDILTEEEVHRLIAVTEHPRDRAFIALLYELGARIGEIGGLNIGDVTRDKYSYLIDLSGKTGHRTPRIVISDPYLTEWIDHHPLNKDSQAPLWISPDHKGSYKRMLYDSLRALVLRLKARAGIGRRLYPHLFRHSRVTHLLAKGILNEAQAKVYFGWVPDSKMLSEYAHLVSRDVNNTILEKYGIKTEQHEKQPLVFCSRCKRINAPEAKYCIQCSSVLDPASAFRAEDDKSRIDELLNLILKDEAIQQAILNKLALLDTSKLKELI